MQESSLSLSTSGLLTGWYCVRTRPKGEHIAARSVQQFAHVEQVFCPRIRFEKPTLRGKVWFVEALFPGYFFAYFDLEKDLRVVNASPSVSGVLRFADFYPQIHSDYISELRGEFPDEEGSVRVIRPGISPGDEVVVTEGAMKGLKTVVTRLLSSGDRIAVLLDWLGQEREAEVQLRSVSRPVDIRQEIR